MNVYFKYDIYDKICFKYIDFDNDIEVEKIGVIFEAEICGSMDMFGLSPDKPNKRYKVQIGNSWFDVNEKNILQKIS